MKQSQKIRFYQGSRPSFSMCSCLSGGQRGSRHDVNDQLANVKVTFGEATQKIWQNTGPESADRLLDQVGEKLLDQGRMRLLVSGQELRQLPRTVKLGGCDA